MAIKNRTAELLNGLMLQTCSNKVAQAALKAVDAIQGERVENQILGIATILICMLNQYNLSHIDVLGIADNMVFSGDNNNMKPDFKAITKYMKNEWRF